MPQGTRDRDESERRLIAAVGSLLTREGFKSLGVNKLAQEAEVSKPMIYDYFGGLNALLHAYIKKKDYWLPLFETLDLPDPKDADAVRELIKGTLLEQFRFFQTAPEMQQLILWQISEEHSLLRRVSDRREAAGAQVLALAEPHFRHTGISLKAITALIVGGIYYMVLHAGTNKSTVCGIDVNLESDRTLVLDTISRLMDWSWEQAAVLKKNKNATHMNYEFELLENLAAQLSARPVNEGVQTEADTMLRNEAKRLERVLLLQLMSLTNDTQISTFLQVNLLKLTAICNQLYRPDGPNADAQLILDLLEAIRKPVAAFIPGNMELPLLFREQQYAGFRRQWETIAVALTGADIPQLLQEIAEIPFQRFLQVSDRQNWQDFKYLKRFGYVLENVLREQPAETDHLTELLIGLGFNHSRFTAWFTRRLRDQLMSLARPERRSLLIATRTRISQVSSLTPLVFDRSKLKPADELLKWLDAELAEYKDDAPRNPNAHKFHTPLRAIELAFWSKLQLDHGIYTERNLDVYSEKIAANHTTEGKDELSPPSVKSKMYTKEATVIDLFENKLLAMLKDIRRYKR